MNRILNLAVVAGLFIFGVGCSKPATPAKVRVVLSWFPGTENAFLYYGQTTGIFKKYGIDLEISPLKGSALVATALSSNQADFGFISSDYIISSVNEKNDLKALLTLYHNTPVTIYSYAKKGIKRPEDLKGKTLAVLTKSSTYPQVISFLKSRNVSGYTEVTGSGAYSDLQKADAAMDYTHYAPVTLLVKEKKDPGFINEIRLSDYPPFSPEFYGPSIATSGTMIKNNPDLVQRFTSAMLESLEKSLQDEKGAAEAIVAGNPSGSELDVMSVGLAKVNKMIADKATANGGPGYMTAAGWERTCIAMKELTIIKEDSCAPNRFFDDTFLKMYREHKKTPK